MITDVNRKTPSMKSELQKKLKSYASLTAGATLFASSANATVQTGSINKTINDLHYYLANYNYSIDLDSDGVIDFIIGEGHNIGGYCPIPLGNFYGLTPFFYGVNGEIITNGTANSNGWIDPNCSWLYNQAGAITSLNYIDQLSSGVIINSTKSFSKNTRLCKNMAISLTFGSTYSYNRYGNWSADSQTNYIGVRFNISGNTHYGWIRVTLNNLNHELIIHDYAYEDTPNTPINAGQMFIAPPPATNPTAIVNGGNIDLNFYTSTGEKAISDYRLFVVKEGTTFGLTEAEANSNYVSITPDGSPNYTHTFTTGTVDTDGNTVLKPSSTLDINGQQLSANQNYNVYVLNIAKTPYATQNSLSTPSNTFTISTVGLSSIDNNFKLHYANNNLNINIDNSFINATLKVYNTLGQIVLEDKIYSSNNSFELNQNQGIYIVTIQKGEAILSEKILIM